MEVRCERSLSPPPAWYQGFAEGSVGKQVKSSGFQNIESPGLSITKPTMLSKMFVGSSHPFIKMASQLVRESKRSSNACSDSKSSVSGSSKTPSVIEVVVTKAEVVDVEVTKASVLVGAWMVVGEAELVGSG